MKTAMKRFIDFKDISIRKKLILFFIMFSLVPTIVIGIVSYKVSESIIKDKEIERTARNLRDADTLVFNYVNTKRKIGVKLSMNHDVVSIMQSMGMDEGRRLQEEFQVKMLLNDYRNTEGIQSIYLFDNNGNAYTNDAERVIYYESLTSSKVYNFSRWYNEILRDKAYAWGNVRQMNHVNTIPFYRIAKDFIGREPVGLVLLNIREDYIYRTYERLEEESGRIIILNQDGRVVSCRNKTLLGQDIRHLTGKSTALSGAWGYYEGSIQKEKYFITYYHNNVLQWTYLYIENLRQIMKARERIKEITILLCVVCLIVTFLFSVFLSRKVTKPVNKLVNLIRLVQQGNLDVEASFKTNDEIGLIGSAFDSMTGRLKKSIADIYEAQQKKREAEMKALLFQINPHFLYNTLTSIIWLTNNNKKKEVINMVSSLSKLFRISISRGKEFITVEEELEHARCYLTIQKIRYKDEFNYEFQYPEDIKRLYTPKLLLQPLIENSIYHGVKNIEYAGLIVIKAFTEGTSLIYEVIDNGNTMTDKEIAYLNHFLANEDDHSDFGIGVRNVNDRIRLFFGSVYGLHYSKENGLTIARITVPLQEGPAAAAIRS